MYKPVLLAAENLHSAIIGMLRSSGYEVVSVRETMHGASDRDVLEKARSLDAILVTEDSDFGELIFSYGISAIGVIFLRYRWQEVEAISKALLTLISTRKPAGSFYTISPLQIRERRLP